LKLQSYAPTSRIKVAKTSTKLGLDWNASMLAENLKTPSFNFELNERLERDL